MTTMQKERFRQLETDVDKVLDAERRHPTVSKALRDGANEAANRRVAGFTVHDPKAESAILDAMIAFRREEIEQFYKDRTEINLKLTKHGIRALAVIPTEAWRSIAASVGLFRLWPNKQGMVAIDHVAVTNLFADISTGRIDQWAHANWKDTLLAMFPGYIQAASNTMVELVLPPPPPEVADVLIKASEFPLQVVAEAAAIGFAKPISELVEQSRRQVREQMPFWQRAGYASLEEWQRLEPIITTDHGSATAVLAQFGPYLLEQAVVESVVKSDQMFGDPSKALSKVRFPDGAAQKLSQAYAQAVGKMVVGSDFARASGPTAVQVQPVGGGGGSSGNEQFFLLNNRFVPFSSIPNS